MKIALVHDYLNEYGGAERVLQTLSDMYPTAPIYTSFYRTGSPAYTVFKNKKIIPSWAHFVPFFASKLHSPLRFLAPFIWNSFDFSDYDVVISSASWYVTKGFTKKAKQTKELCYCHTPPRYLYGYNTAVNWQKYPLVKAYSAIVGHFMRMYDFRAASRVDQFVANSNEVKNRIQKFYRRESVIIYPPVSLPVSKKTYTKKDYYFIVSRLVGAKGLDLAVAAAKEAGIKLKIAGVAGGYSSQQQKLQQEANSTIELLGKVSDADLVDLYSEAKGFLAVSTDEDFGITPVESMLCGTPVIAFKGGGYTETVLAGKTGVFFDEPTVASLTKAIKQFEKIHFDPEACRKQAARFSRAVFEKNIRALVAKLGKQ